VWTVKQSHAIEAGVEWPLVIPKLELYGELFEFPERDVLFFISSFEGGEVFRSGVTFSRGKGRIFYFSPGDQEYPVYHQPQIQRVIANGVGWVAQPKQFREAPGVANPQRDWYLA
jgi:trehalose utilization protein